MAILKTEVVREWPAIGSYRIRVLTNSKKAASVDIREYVSADTFEGFTRRGIALKSRADIARLRDILEEVLASDAFSSK
jgi:hypothetical protein